MAPGPSPSTSRVDQGPEARLWSSDVAPGVGAVFHRSGQRLARLVAAMAVSLLILACSGGGQQAVRQGEAAANRFSAAIARIAETLGKPAAEVESGIRLKLPTATIDDLARQAEKTADETAALRRIAEQAAREAEEVKTLEAIHGATCDLVNILDQLAEASPEAQQQVFVNAIFARMQQQGLHPSDAKAAEIWDAVLGQYSRLSQDGSIDPGQIAIDLACLA